MEKIFTFYVLLISLNSAIGSELDYFDQSREIINEISSERERVDCINCDHTGRKIYNSIAGAIGNTLDYISNTITKASIDTSQYVPSKSIQQCSAPLPTAVASEVIGPLTQMKHTWIDIQGLTFGMPYTLNETYFGGAAMINSPDPFVAGNMNYKRIASCEPIYRPKEIDDEKFSRRVNCIAKKLSNQNSDWLAVLDYNALTNNCLSSVRFITECAGGKIPQNPNLRVGGDISNSKKAILMEKSTSLNHEYDKVTAEEHIIIKRGYFQIANNLTSIKWSFNENGVYNRDVLDPAQILLTLEDTKYLVESLIDIEDNYSIDSDLSVILQEIETLEGVIGGTQYNTVKGREVVKASLDLLSKQNLNLNVASKEVSYLSLCEKARSECAN